jgi:hypothetical protein
MPVRKMGGKWRFKVGEGNARSKDERGTFKGQADSRKCEGVA